MDNMETRKILIIEDDEKIAELLKDYLMMSGFHVEVLYDGDNVLSLWSLDI